MDGGKIRIGTFRKLLDESYAKKPAHVLDGYVLDPETSTRKDRVYYNPDTNDVAVVHRGTWDAADIKTDLLYAVGVKDRRFKDARRVHAKVAEKYPDADKQVLGHSLGGLIAQDNARDAAEVITLNKPVFIQDVLRRHANPRQMDVRANVDIGALLAPFDARAEQLKIETDTRNPIKAHQTSILNNLPENMEIGF
jgi:hypothetical protein